MTEEERLMSQPYLTVSDMERIFDCGTAKAQGIIRAIKVTSDKLHLKGKVLPSDFLYWKNKYDN